MKTEQEIIRRIKELEESDSPLDIKVIEELKWVLKGEKNEKRERELFDIYHTKLKGKQKAVFNALRRFEARLDRPIKLEEVQAESFIFNSELVGFGEQSRQIVLNNPDNYLF